MTVPIDPVRLPLVEPAAPTRPVVRRHEEPHDEEPRHREREQERRQEDETEEPDGLHVDVLA